jgi:hypothetical protein
METDFGAPEPMDGEEVTSPRTQFMWADDLFAYLDSVELSFSEETLVAGDQLLDTADTDAVLHNGRAVDDLGPHGEPLADGALDPLIASRRAKNRLSAQLSRRRKKQYMTCLQARLKDLETVSKLLDDSLIATHAQNMALQQDLREAEWRMQPVMQTDETVDTKRQRVESPCPVI